MVTIYAPTVEEERGMDAPKLDWDTIIVGSHNIPPILMVRADKKIKKLMVSYCLSIVDG